MVQLIATEQREAERLNTRTTDQPTAAESVPAVGSPVLSLRELQHEVGNALTPALGYVEFLLRRAPQWSDERDLRALKAIAGSLRRARRLVRRAGPDADNDTQPYDLGTLAEAVVCQMAPTRRPDVVLRRHVSEHDRALVGEWGADRVAQILANLLNNAAKYSIPGTPIRVDVRSAGPWAEIAVTDSGIGIEPGEIEAVFGGHRTEAARRWAEGSGIGLALSRRLAEAQGGSLTATSVPGRGSTFVLRLPHERHKEVVA